MQSMIFKWLKSENCSSIESKRLGTKTRKAFGLSSKEYRKLLSKGRKKEDVLERLMSAGQWDKIDFSHIPSKAGLIYKNAFARHDVERIKAGAQTYEAFAKDTNTKVNTKTLYPYEVVAKATSHMFYNGWSHSRYTFNGADTDRAIINKYWLILQTISIRLLLMRFVW